MTIIKLNCIKCGSLFKMWTIKDVPLLCLDCCFSIKDTTCSNIVRINFKKNHLLNKEDF